MTDQTANMGKKSFTEAYHPLRFKHPNNFPYSLRCSDDNFSASFEKDDVVVEVPIVYMPSEDKPETPNHTYSSASAFDITLKSSTPTDHRQRSILLKSLQVLPELIGSDTTIPPRPQRRRPSILRKPLLIPCRHPLPPLPSLPPPPPTNRSHPAPKITLAPMQARPRCDGVPQTPSSQAPARLTSLLTNVLSVMNTIMDRKHNVQEEDAILLHLTELVAIMQEEAEALLDLADLVEEFVEQVEITSEVADVEGWVEELGLDQARAQVGTSSMKAESIMASMPVSKNATGRHGHRAHHEREGSFDSAVGMIDESEFDGVARELRESIHRDVVLQVAQMGKRERERGNLIEIGKTGVQRAGEKKLDTQFLTHHQKAPLGSTKLTKRRPHRDELPCLESGLVPSPLQVFKRSLVKNNGKERPPRWI
ncbi:hypothetical protein PZA11_005463 [Diplocarpon coronariae]